MRHRYFSVDLGRFLSRDPLGLWADRFNLGNAYGYVGDGPMSRIDRFGLQTDADHVRSAGGKQVAIALEVGGMYFEGASREQYQESMDAVAGQMKEMLLILDNLATLSASPSSGAREVGQAAEEAIADIEFAIDFMQQGLDLIDQRQDVMEHGGSLAVGWAGGALVVGAARALQAARAARIWSMSPFARGWAIEGIVGTNLPPCFPVIDRFARGVATSLKSLNLLGKSYRSTGRVFSRLKKYINDLRDFRGAAHVVQESRREISRRRCWKLSFLGVQLPLNRSGWTARHSMRRIWVLTSSSGSSKRRDYADRKRIRHG